MLIGRKYSWVAACMAVGGFVVTFLVARGKGQQNDVDNGAIIPGYVLRAPSGSRADVRARGTFSKGRWTVVFTRPLTTAFPGEDRQFEGLPTGTTYRFGVAVLDNTGGGRSKMVFQDPAVYTLGSEASPADVKARRVTVAPTADPNDPNWGEPFMTRGGTAGSMAVPVVFSASFDANNLYLLAIWADATATENDLKEHWVFDGARWTAQPAAQHDEDRLAIFWDINVTDFASRGCWALCHNDTRMGSLVSQERADLWHWKAARTNPLGFADDQRLRDGQFGGIEMAGRSDDTGTGLEVRNADRSGSLPAFVGDGGPGNGTKFLIQLPEGARPAVAFRPQVDGPFLKPGLYTHDGARAVLVHNADYSLVSGDRPLERGEFAFLYASGLGRVTNHRPTESSTAEPALMPALGDVAVTLAGLRCEVHFAGLAPGFLAVYQVNFRVPASAPSGLQDLAVTAGGASSQAAKAPVR